MEATSNALIPMRITDLVDAKLTGSAVVVQARFDILPVDFRHDKSPFQAYIFLVRFHGAIDQHPFEFRKCYARGCPNNLCTHVSQAVQIANRYLQRDYRELTAVGIDIEKKLFTLDDMVVRFERLKSADRPGLTIPELVGLALAGRQITVEIELNYMPAVEHFAGRTNAQTFLSGDITAKADQQTYCCHRCFACFATQNADEAKPMAITVANARLEIMYREFKRVGIAHQKVFFQ